MGRRLLHYEFVAPTLLHRPRVSEERETSRARAHRLVEHGGRPLDFHSPLAVAIERAESGAGRRVEHGVASVDQAEEGGAFENVSAPLLHFPSGWEPGGAVPMDENAQGNTGGEKGRTDDSADRAARAGEKDSLNTGRRSHGS